MTPFWLFQAPENRQSLFGVFRGLKWPYVGVFRGLERHLIGWKRWYYGSILKWLTNTEKTVPTQSGSVQVLPQHIFFVGGGLALQQLSKGRLSKETIVQRTVQGTVVQGYSCPRRLLSKDNFCPRRLLSQETVISIIVQGSRQFLDQKFFNQKFPR